MKKKISPTSILIGILTFGLLGAGIYSGLLRLEILSENITTNYLLIGIGSLFGAYLGFIKPISTELWSYAITGLVTFQAGWDIMRDIQSSSDPRVITFLIAVGIFTLNSFTGKYRLKKGIKQLKRLAGR